MSTLFRLNFNAGEIVPELAYRNDLAKFQNACRRLENFLVTPYGAVRRRPGTAVMRPVSALDTTKPVRMFPLAATNLDRFVVIIGAFITPAVLDEDTGAEVAAAYSSVRLYVVNESTSDTDATTRASFGVTAGHEMALDGSVVAWAVGTAYSTDALVWATSAAGVATVYKCLAHGNGVAGHDPTVTESPAHWEALVSSDGLAAPWPIGSLELIQAVQVNDVMLFTHPDVCPKRLEHNSDTVWSFKNQEVYGGPFLDGEEASGEAASRTCSLTFKQVVGGIDGVIPEWGNAVGDVYAAGTYVYYTSSSRKVLYRSKKSTDVAPNHDHKPNLIASREWWELSSGVVAEAGTQATSVHISFSGAVFTGDAADWVGVPFAVLINDSNGAICENWTARAPVGDEVIPGQAATAGTYTEPMPAFGVVQMSTNGVWAGEVALEESTDGGTTWVEIGTIVSNRDGASNGQIERETSGRASLVRARLKSRLTVSREWMDATTKAALIEEGSLPPSDTGCAITLKRIGEVWVYGTIIAVSDSTHATFLLSAPLSEEIINSPRWSEGVFSTRNGFPRALTIHQERLWYGGNYKRPQSIWASAINDWGDFRLGTMATSAMAFTLAAENLNSIRWLRTGKSLSIGTDSAEWTLEEMNKQDALTPTNCQVRRHSEFGSAAVQACSMCDVGVFLQRNARRLRSFIYNYESDGMVSPDLSMLGKHILAAGVTQLAFQRTPDPILWCLLADGRLASFTYDRDNEVLGWARHNIADVDAAAFTRVLAIAAQPGTIEDEMWLLVEQVRSGGNSLFSLVAMRPLYATQDGEQREQHIDLAAYSVDPDVATDGQWDGLDFASLLEPTGMAAPDGQHGKRARISGVRLFTLGASGGAVSADGGVTWEPLRVQLPGEPFGDGQFPAVTGQTRIGLNSGFTDDATIKIKSAGQHPLTVCALGVELERYE